MVLNMRIDGDVVILSNFGRLLNDPRHFDAGRDVREMLGRGYQKFIFELGGMREMGATAIGLLTTLTRQIRKEGGEAVLTHLSPSTEKYIEMMRMDAYWEVFDGVEDAEEFFRHGER
ncbi:MAG: STAS domain-containing protein [Planctomycetaceae bacterium]|nr:STAS domain-containing protein [Planctomycetaceae bacterium]MBV8316099.1 STAS domain-containing protein [Planctomycetaceae bacterium]MBV8606258.1 STAS domain-containing protein [Singulisphaera sp.]